MNPRKPNLQIIGLGHLDQYQRDAQDQHLAPRDRGHTLLAVPHPDTPLRMPGSLASAVAWEAVGIVQTSDSRRVGAGVCEDGALLNLAELWAFQAAERGPADFQCSIVAARAAFSELGKLETRKAIEGAPKRTEGSVERVVFLVWMV